MISVHIIFAQLCSVVNVKKKWKKGEEEEVKN
jgi:hypothetical protein